MTNLAFYLWMIFSPQILLFLEEFKSINYYYLFALTMLLPEANMILKNGQQHL